MKVHLVHNNRDEQLFVRIWSDCQCSCCFALISFFFPSFVLPTNRWLSLSLSLFTPFHSLCSLHSLDGSHHSWVPVVASELTRKPINALIISCSHHVIIAHLIARLRWHCDDNRTSDSFYLFHCCPWISLIIIISGISIFTIFVCDASAPFHCVCARNSRNPIQLPLFIRFVALTAQCRPNLAIYNLRRRSFGCISQSQSPHSVWLWRNKWHAGRSTFEHKRARECASVEQ